MEKDNYQKWRDILRTQLTSTASLFFAFSSATLGFVITKLLDAENPLDAKTIGALAECVRPIYFSLAFYTLFMMSRLGDYFHTQYLFRPLKDGRIRTEAEVRVKTQIWFGFTWGFFALQISYIICAVINLKAAIILGISHQ